MVRRSALLLLVLTLGMSVTGTAGANFPALRPIVPGDTVLVVAPHPDDESLCCGGLIDAARRNGAQVAVVWITFGDGFRWSAMVAEHRLRPRNAKYREFALLREAEARKAAAILRVDSSSLYFLGYPDRGVFALLADHYDPGTPWRSKFTGANSVVYQDAVSPGAEYSGADLVRDFSRVLDQVKPTLVLAPSPQDTHPDHRGAGILAWRVMKERNRLDDIRFWIVHGGRGWPTPRAYRPELPQVVAPRGAGMQWEEFALDEAARAAKLQATLSHRTQVEVMGRVMRSHVRATELYSRIPMPPRSVCALFQPCEFGTEPPLEKSGL